MGGSIGLVLKASRERASDTWVLVTGSFCPSDCAAGLWPDHATVSPSHRDVRGTSRTELLPHLAAIVCRPAASVFPG
eukprot:scaffold201467_cov23-Prasinocladus_malaysianus.AAC.1